jgi:ABC-2 type transport system permease protein
MSIISLIIKESLLPKCVINLYSYDLLSPLLFVCIAAFVGYLSSMKAETKRIAIHDESGCLSKNL